MVRSGVDKALGELPGSLRRSRHAVGVNIRLIARMVPRPRGLAARRGKVSGAGDLAVVHRIAMDLAEFPFRVSIYDRSNSVVHETFGHKSVRIGMVVPQAGNDKLPVCLNDLTVRRIPALPLNRPAPNFVPLDND